MENNYDSGKDIWGEGNGWGMTEQGLKEQAIAKARQARERMGIKLSTDDDEDDDTDE